MASFRRPLPASSPRLPWELWGGSSSGRPGQGEPRAPRKIRGFLGKAFSTGRHEARSREAARFSLSKWRRNN